MAALFECWFIQWHGGLIESSMCHLHEVAWSWRDLQLDPVAWKDSGSLSKLPDQSDSRNFDASDFANASSHWWRPVTVLELFAGLQWLGYQEWLKVLLLQAYKTLLASRTYYDFTNSWFSSSDESLFTSQTAIGWWCNLLCAATCSHPSNGLVSRTSTLP
jgi:hypothetical protein